MQQLLTATGETGGVTEGVSLSWAMEHLSAVQHVEQVWEHIHCVSVLAGTGAWTCGSHTSQAAELAHYFPLAQRKKIVLKI